MNRELVIAEWRRAQQALGSAQLLTRGGYYEDAIARIYYALFHAAKAALHVHDISADTHNAVRRMFGLHLIKPGEIEAQWSAPLGQTFDERQAADYNPQVSFSAKEANDACRDARAFVRRIRSYLLANGFTVSQLRRRRKKRG
jgi:uncharacterized protein (UPF0332 family)